MLYSYLNLLAQKNMTKVSSSYLLYHEKDHGYLLNPCYQRLDQRRGTGDICSQGILDSPLRWKG